MSDRASPAEPAVRPGRATAWRFLRTVLGLYLLGWLAAAMLSPPDPFTFLLLLAPSWLVGTVAAWWLVYREGYETLRASERYGPGFSPSRALLAFVVVTVATKLLGTTLLALTVDGRSFAVDLAVSLFALGVAGLLVVSGLLARVTGMDRA